MIQEKIVDLHLPYPNEKDRLVRVYIPEHDENQTLPVIYMTDGQNLFEEENCKYGCWHIREAVREEFKNTGKSAVIVGIYNDNPKKRGKELTPKSIGKFQYPSFMAKIMISLFLKPQGEIFNDFIINTLKPHIEKNFPVKTGRNNTAFCGSSMGGLMSFFTGLSNSDVFSMAGVFSPNVMMYSKEDMKNWIQSKLTQNKTYLYMYAGKGNDMESKLYPAFEQTCQTLKEIYPKEFLKIVVKENGMHHESHWEPVFKDFLHDFLAKNH